MGSNPTPSAIIKMNICVFLSSSIGKDSVYAETAFELGKQIAISKHKLVYGGGGVGLMNELANGCLSEGGDVLSLIHISEPTRR